jgi:hypothetical protein
VTLVLILIALVASSIAGLIKLLFFRKSKDAYLHILKIALLGELFGTIIMFATGYLFQSRINKSDEPEVLLAIPTCLMLGGLLTGSMWIYFKGRKAVIR